MTIDWNTRETKLTNAEFAALERNADGDVIDLSLAYPFITDAQREKLSGDDWSRMIDMDEEMACMLADLAAEFG